MAVEHGPKHDPTPAPRSISLFRRDREAWGSEPGSPLHTFAHTFARNLMQ
jgi:hypothetical protein